MYRYIIVFVFSFSFIQANFAQEKNPEDIPSFSEESFEQKYEKRIKKERILGVYIPKDLTDAFIQLNRLIEKSDQAKFKSLPEETAASKLHFSLGRWMIHNWGFYEGSRLSHYLKEKIGLSHPDDMAKFIMITYHRNLSKTELKVKDLAEKFIESRHSAHKKNKTSGKVISKEVRKKPKN